MKKQLALATLAALALPAAAQEAVTLKFHHIWPPQAMAPVRVIDPWCKKVEAESAGKIKCQMLPAMSGGGTPAQLVDRIKDGVDDLTITLPGYTAGRFPMMEVFELPFMTASAEAGASAAWDYLQKYAVKEFPGTKVLATWVHDEGYVHTAAKPVKTLDDFKGLKMRAPTRQTNKLLAKLGAAPVGMPVPAVADAISKGTIDGFVLPWEVIPAFKLHEMTKFHTETDPSRPAMYSAGFIFAMNQAKYDALPADLKKVIDANSGAALSKQIGKIWDESQAVGRKAAQDRGNTISVLSAAETDKWIAASTSLYDEWVADMDKRGLKGKEMLDDAKALLTKYKEVSWLAAIARAFAMLGAAVALGAAMMVVVSIAGRATVAAPIPGDVELTQFAIALAISLGLPWCQLRGANIIVDFFTQRMRPTRQRALDGIGALLIAAMCALLAWRTGVGAIAVREASETTMILGLPMWWAYASLAPGLTLAAVIAVVQAVGHFRGTPVPTS